MKFVNLLEETETFKNVKVNQYDVAPLDDDENFDVGNVNAANAQDGQNFFIDDFRRMILDLQEGQILNVLKKSDETANLRNKLP